MSGNGFCFDCPAYWEYDGCEWCFYKHEPTREHHAACEAKPMLERLFNAIDREIIKGDGKPAIGIL